MEALSILKFWRNQTAVADVRSECAAAATTTTTTTTDEDDTTDDEDSFFDLVFEPSSNNKNFHFVESPKSTKTNNLSSVTDDSIKPSSSPVTTLRYPSVSKPKSFSLSFKKSSKSNDDSTVLEQSRRFVRDNSLRSKMMSESCGTTADQTTSVSRYFRLIKPLVSKKGRVTEILTPFASPVNASTRKLTQSGRVGSFKMNINVGRSSWKGRSVFPAAAATVSGTADAPRRRDDSLLEQQNDGIQGAILHCKRSYSSSSSSSSSSQECSQLIRSASDPSHEKFVAQGRFSCEEQKRCSI